MRPWSRRLGAVAATLVFAVTIATPAAAVPPIDTTSTTGIHIETVPSAGAATAVVVGGSDNGWVALSTAVWRATGYPEPVVAPNGNPNLSVLAISDNDIVAGNYLVNGTQRRAFVLRPDGTFLTLPSPPGDSGVLDVVPVAVANDGSVVGTFHAVADTCRTIAAVCGFLATPFADGSGYTVETFTTPEDQPFLPTGIGGTGEDIVVAGGGKTWTRAGGYQELQGIAVDRPGTARSINAAGALAGTVSPEDGVVQAAYWASPSAAPVAIPAIGTDVHGFARDLNESGQVVGWSGASSSPSGIRHAFVWDAANGTTDLGTLPGGTSAEAMAITEDGRVVGESDDRPVLWDLDGDADLDHPPEVGIVSLPPREVDAGGPVVIELAVTDPEGDPYEFVIDGLPGGSYDVATDTFRWDTGPGDVGEYSFTFTVRQVDDPTNAYVLPIRLPLTVNPGDVVDPVEIAVSETVTVSDDVTVRPAIRIAIEEVVTVSDEVAVRPAVRIAIAETVTITDDVGVEVPAGPVTITISESINVSDGVTVTPSVRLVIDEAVTVTGDVLARPSVLLTISENVTVDDAVSLLTSIRLRLEEVVTIGDDVGIVVDPDGDGDGIVDSIDGRSVAGTFEPAAGVFSDDFSDQHRSGTTYGFVLDRGTLDPAVTDVAAGGVRVITGSGVATARTDLTLCALPGRVRVLPSSSATFRCGSLFATVEAGGIEIELSDGAVLAVDAPGSVVVRDDGTDIEVEVFSGPARLVDEEGTTELAGGSIVRRPEQPADDGPLPAPMPGSPTPAVPATPVATRGDLALTGSLPIGTLVLAGVSSMLLGIAAMQVGNRRAASRRLGRR